MPEVSSEIENYISFVNQLDSHIQNFSDKSVEWNTKALQYIDGLAASELRKLVPLEIQRQIGAFFTPKSLSRSIIEEVFPDLDQNSVIYDPACGAGNLLLSTWDYLNDCGVKPTSEHFLLGTDIFNPFVQATIKRMEIKNLIMNDPNTPLKIGYKIKLSDGLNDNSFYKLATHVFINPPYNLMPSPDYIKWSSGMVSSAAVFLDRVINYVNEGTTITAILPEVLRCGSRYNRWRALISSICSNEKIKLLGQFNKYADVDVFAITLRKSKVRVPITDSDHCFILHQKSLRTIKDDFSVCVGTVVDNRDKHSGKKRGYIVSRDLKGWSVQTNFKKTRQHTGKFFKGPLIVIKRTSRLGDKQRAVATILNTRNPVYVDNHLIVLTPKSGNLQECYAVMSNLKDARTDSWLNEEIRCRHLTVKVVSDIPIW